MPKPRECTPLTLHVIGNLDLCAVLLPRRSAISGHPMGRLPCGVNENVFSEAVFCVTSIKTDSILKPTSMISCSVDGPTHVSNLSRCVARLDGARLLHQPSCLRRNSIVVVPGADVPTRWPRHVTCMWWMGLSVGLATPFALASTLAHEHVSCHWIHQPTMRCNSPNECQEA
jgi:hypothetical protein